MNGIPAWAQNFIESCREQGFLLPPDVRERPPGDHLAWFVIDAVAEMDLEGFYAVYRADGHGRAAYEPSVMVALILYAFATNVRSSRAIERHCRQDVAFRVITGNLVPDHATIVRFICLHERALAEAVHRGVKKLCQKAGLVERGWCRSTGRGLQLAPAERSTTGSIRSRWRSSLRSGRRTRPRMKSSGRRVGMSCPRACAHRRGAASSSAELASSCSVARTKARRLRTRASRGAAAEREYEFDPEQIVTHTAGRRGWLRVAARQLERQRWENPDPIKRSRKERLLLAAERLEDDLGSERAGNQAYEDYRARGRNALRSPFFGRPPDPYQPPEVPEGKVNITDPDSKQIPDGLAFVQGYNVEAAVNEQQIVLAAEITNTSTDFSLLGPMVSATIDELRRAGNRSDARGGCCRRRLLERTSHRRDRGPQAHPCAHSPGQGQPRYPVQDMDRGPL